MGAPGGGAAAVKPHRTSGGAKGWHPDARERDKVVSQKRQENQHLAVTPGSRNAQQTPARPGNPKRCAAGGRKGSCQGVSSMGFLSRSPKSPRRRPKTLARPSRTRAHRHTGLLVCIQRSRTIGPVQTRPYQLHGAHPQQTSPPFKLPPPALATGCARRGAGRARGWPGAGARVLQVVPAHFVATHAACSEQPIAERSSMTCAQVGTAPVSARLRPETKGALSLKAPLVVIAPQCCLVQGPQPCECALSESPLPGPCHQPRTWFTPSRSAQHPQP